MSQLGPMPPMEVPDLGQPRHPNTPSKKEQLRLVTLQLAMQTTGAVDTANTVPPEAVVKAAQLFEKYIDRG